MDDVSGQILARRKTRSAGTKFSGHTSDASPHTHLSLSLSPHAATPAHCNELHTTTTTTTTTTPSPRERWRQQEGEHTWASTICLMYMHNCAHSLLSLPLPPRAARRGKNKNNKKRNRRPSQLTPPARVTVSLPRHKESPPLSLLTHLACWYWRSGAIPTHRLAVPYNIQQFRRRNQMAPFQWWDGEVGTTMMMSGNTSTANWLALK